MNTYLDNGRVFGARACVVIEYGGALEQLAAELAVALNLKSFNVEASECPPYTRIGSAEAMGWEVWLEEEPAAMPHHFRLRTETEHSLKESFEDKMHDLSPWLARLIATLCGVKAQPCPRPTDVSYHG